jgi:hypothetical protein
MKVFESYVFDLFELISIGYILMCNNITDLSCYVYVITYELYKWSSLYEKN